MADYCLLANNYSANTNMGDEIMEGVDELLSVVRGRNPELNEQIILVNKRVKEYNRDYREANKDKMTYSHTLKGRVS